MAILIKDMAMPENCGECPFYKTVLGLPSSNRICIILRKVIVQSTWVLFYKERYKDCPLVEIKRPKYDTALLEAAGMEM